MTTAFDLRQITPTPRSEQVVIRMVDQVTLDDEQIDIYCGDLSLQVSQHTTLHRGLATTEIHSVQLYLSACCLVPFELPADLEIRLINGIEAYFEHLTEQRDLEDAAERRMALLLARMEDADRYVA